MSESALTLTTAVPVSMEPGWRLDRQVHEDRWEVLILTHGQLGTVVRGESIRANPGDVMIYPAGCPHEEWNAGLGHLQAIYVAYHGAPPNHPLSPTLPDSSGHLRYLASWMAELQHDAAAKALQQRLADALLAAILSPPTQSSMVGRVRAHMQANLARPITLNELADHAGLSRAYFARFFAREAGVTPMRMLQRIRVDSACGLLVTTDLPLKAIAARTGFADEFHMSKVFRRVCGRPPGAFRKVSAKTPEN